MPQNPAKGGRDNFPTPQIYADFAAKRLLELVPDKDEYNAIEPGCGATAPFLRGLRSAVEGTDVELKTMGVEMENWGPIADLPPGADVFYCTDFLTEENMDPRQNWRAQQEYFDLICTNPPFSVCEKFLEQSFELLDPWGAMVYLLRLPVLGGEKRMHIWETRPPVEVATFIRRISFDGIGTDYAEYGLFFWLGTKLESYYRKATKQDYVKFYWIDNTSKTLKKGDGLRPFGM